jgi:hypothetical protein
MLRDRRLVLAQCAYELRIGLQMRGHELLRCERQALVERPVGIIVALKDFQETQRGVAGVLDIVPRGERHKAHVVEKI